MKLNKNKNCKTIDLSTTNPFRPPQAFERKYTICRITEGSTISVHPSFYIQVDADLHKVENFAQEIYELPEKDRYFCGVLEMFYVKKKYLSKIKKLAKNSFDKVVVENINGEVECLKSLRKSN